MTKSAILVGQQKTRSISEPGLMCLRKVSELASNVYRTIPIIRFPTSKSIPKAKLLPKHIDRLRPAAAATICRWISIGLNREKGNEKPTLTGLELRNSLKILGSKTLKYVYKITYRVQLFMSGKKHKRSPTSTSRKTGNEKLMCWSR